jgi:putative CocE/NonD family hydrolase
MNTVLTDITRRAFIRQVNALAFALGTGSFSAARANGSLPPVATPVDPKKIRMIEQIWIPMSDGTRIAARMWLPDDADKMPVPALMEYIPYRTRDFSRLRDDQIHGALASFGYACIRPDIRGSGDSGGLPQDEYVKKEQDDGVEIIAWLARQPWCTGKVGMFGTSWGGFSCLQIAARQPAALKAIITNCSTDDRYTDDEHYVGGCITEGMFDWGSGWTNTGLLPPDPAIVGEAWRDQWLERLNNLDFFLANWLTHQHRDTFWKHGSVDEDYAAISCAVYAMGGWVDPYHSTVPRMLANLRCPRKGLIGPWRHGWPQSGVPGPAIDWVGEAVRWWDYWLKGNDTGIMNEPIFRVWMQDTPAMRGSRSVPGRWVAEEAWPSARIVPMTYFITAAGLQKAPAAEVIHELKPLQTVGITAPRWLAGDMDTDLPDDQRIDDARSLCFDSQPLAGNVEILGAAKIEIDLSVDRPVAFLIARLNEVEPDGVSKRLAYGVLNLTHRLSHECPQPLEPGKRYRISLKMQDCGQRIKSGNRLRIALSTAYWPMIWPSPEAVTLTMYSGKSKLELPIRPVRSGDDRLAPFGIPSVLDGSTLVTVVREGKPSTAIVESDPRSRAVTFRSDSDSEITRINATGTEMSSSSTEVMSVRDDEPTSAVVEHSTKVGLERGDWKTRCESFVRLSLTKDEFLLTADLKAYDQSEEIFARRWSRTIPRQLV